MSNDTRTPENGQAEPPEEPKKPWPWKRWALVGAAVTAVAGTAVVYPQAAVPLGLGLTALQLLRRNGRDK